MTGEYSASIVLGFRYEEFGKSSLCILQNSRQQGSSTYVPIMNTIEHTRRIKFFCSTLPFSKIFEIELYIDHLSALEKMFSRKNSKWFLCNLNPVEIIINNIKTI